MYQIKEEGSTEMNAKVPHPLLGGSNNYKKPPVRQLGLVSLIFQFIHMLVF